MADIITAASLRANPNPIDPDVKVPAAVRRAAEAADAAQRAAYPGQAEEPAPPAPPTNPDTINIAPPSPPPTPQPPAPPVTPPGNEPTPPQPTTGSAEDWAQKFRSAEGRRLKLEQQLGQAHDRIALFEGELNELRARINAAPAPTPAQTRLVTEQEENEFGPEMLDVMGRRAKESISPELAELRSMMNTLASKVDGATTAVTRNARADMLKDLDRDLPEWRQINITDEFKAWLALPDPYFGASRHSALTKAYEQNDTARVLNFFNGFVSDLAASTPATDLTVQPAPAPQPARPTLEALAAPGRARTSAQPNAPAEKQIITTADIDAFYAAVRRGAYRGREAEQASLEQELFAAQREGRVRAA